MINTHFKYMCYPSVVEVGKETEVTVFPRDISRMFREEWEYSLAVVDLLGDQIDYYNKAPYDHDFRIEGGCLKFKHVFEKEQEYQIRIKVKGTEEKVSMYAVEEDLYSLRAFKGDLHTHTYYSDGGDGLMMTPADYREMGFDFVAITDHNRMFTSLQAKKFYDGVKTDLNVISGEEVHTPGSIVHIVHVGGKTSVCEKYIENTEKYKKEVEALEKEYTHIPEQYRSRVAMARWACDKIHEAGGIAIFAHPFWCPDRYNVSEEFRNYLFGENLFDAYELIGGIGNVKNNLQLALWQEECRKGNNISVVGSSDSHDHALSKGFGNKFTVVFAKENTAEAIMEAVKNGMSVAAELTKGDEADVRFYGSLRLVMFAHYLYNTYFVETAKLSFGEGILMRRYAEGEDVGEILSSLSGTETAFYNRFYGKTEAPSLPKERIEYLDECLKLQREKGPLTKGSHIKLHEGKERRE